MYDPDTEHLKLLSIFHYVLAGLFALAGCFPILHLVIGIVLVKGAIPGKTEQFPPPEFGWFFVGIAAAAILFAWTLAVLLFLAGRRLSSRRGLTFCTVVAALECLVFPLGTVLGVFTLIVLSRDSVKRLFQVVA